MVSHFTPTEACCVWISKPRPSCVQKTGWEVPRAISCSCLHLGLQGNANAIPQIPIKTRMIADTIQKPIVFFFPFFFFLLASPLPHFSSLDRIQPMCFASTGGQRDKASLGESPCCSSKHFPVCLPFESIFLNKESNPEFSQSQHPLVRPREQNQSSLLAPKGVKPLFALFGFPQCITKAIYFFN